MSTPFAGRARQPGKSSYAPACANEWVRGVCEKPRIKCGDCSHPPANSAIRCAHLRPSGRRAHDRRVPLVGRYYSCYFVAVDFDEAEWREDARAFMGDPARRLACLRRWRFHRRSGCGAHAWSILRHSSFGPRRTAPGHGHHQSHVRTHAAAQAELHRPAVPQPGHGTQGGFGNLIALPLQKRPTGQRPQCVSSMPQLAALPGSVGVPRRPSKPAGRSRPRANNICRPQLVSIR